MTNPQTLTSVPADEEHAPQLGQAVEILRCRSNLTDGNYIAAPEGFVTTLTQAYSFDTGTLGPAILILIFRRLQGHLSDLRWRGGRRRGEAALMAGWAAAWQKRA
jgi:hypothetical protein